MSCMYQRACLLLSSIECSILLAIYILQACKLLLFFSISLSYVRPGTRFDLTCSQFGQAKKRRENNMFQCSKITLEVSSQLFNEDHTTSL